MELNLLDPSWLSSAVATFYMCKLTGIHISHLPTLTDIVKNFVDIKLTAENVDSSTESDAGVYKLQIKFIWVKILDLSDFEM